MLNIKPYAVSDLSAGTDKSGSDEDCVVATSAAAAHAPEMKTVADNDNGDLLSRREVLLNVQPYEVSELSHDESFAGGFAKGHRSLGIPTIEEDESGGDADREGVRAATTRRVSKSGADLLSRRDMMLAVKPFDVSDSSMGSDRSGTKKSDEKTEGSEVLVAAVASAGAVGTAAAIVPVLISAQAGESGPVPASSNSGDNSTRVDDDSVPGPGPGGHYLGGQGDCAPGLLLRREMMFWGRRPSKDSKSQDSNQNQVEPDKGWTPRAAFEDDGDVKQFDSSGEDDDCGFFGWGDRSEDVGDSFDVSDLGRTSANGAEKIEESDTSAEVGCLKALESDGGDRNPQNAPAVTVGAHGGEEHQQEGNGLDAAAAQGNDHGDVRKLFGLDRASVMDQLSASHTEQLEAAARQMQEEMAAAEVKELTHSGGEQLEAAQEAQGEHGSVHSDAEEHLPEESGVDTAAIDGGDIQAGAPLLLGVDRASLMNELDTQNGACRALFLYV